MNPSPELVELMRSSYAALERGDESFYADHLSQQEGVLIIGTDPSEWWADSETISSVFKAQLRALPGVSILPGEIVAYSEGSFGWAADRPTFRLPNGTAIPLRMTVVFARQDNIWKIVHQHISIGVANQETVGQELPVA